MPAFAISQEYYEHPDFTLAAQIAYLAAVNILEHGLAPGELININVPGHQRRPSATGVEVTRMGKRVYQDELIERLDPRGIPYYWIGGPPPSGLAEPGTDFHAVVNRRIAITPIQLDLTAQRLLDRLNPGHGSCPRPAPAAPPLPSRHAGRRAPGRDRHRPGRARRRAPLAPGSTVRRGGAGPTITSRAALRPGMPVTPPPGWAPEPQRYRPSSGIRYREWPRSGRHAKNWSSAGSPCSGWPPVRP